MVVIDVYCSKITRMKNMSSMTQSHSIYPKVCNRLPSTASRGAGVVVIVGPTLANGVRKPTAKPDPKLR